MTHVLKVAASFLHQNVIVHIASHPCKKFHTDIITPSSKTIFNLSLNWNLTSKFPYRKSKLMTLDLKVAASLSHQNVAVPITSYPCTKFHSDIITPSSKTTLNLNLNRNLKSKFPYRKSKSMTHDLKVAASFSHQNVAVPITSYPCTKFHDDVITPSL